MPGTTFWNSASSSAFRTLRKSGEEKELEFRGRCYGPEATKRLLNFLDRDLEEDRRRLADVDREVFLVHWQMSRQLGPTASDSLRQRYDFHLALQKILGTLLQQQGTLESTLAYLGRRQGPLPGHVFHDVVTTFREVHDALTESLEAADRLPLPPPNLKAGAPLGPLLYDNRLVSQFRRSGTISGKKVGKLHEQLTEVIDRARRLHSKSLGRLPALQEELARQWLARFAGGRAGSAAAVTDKSE